VKQAKNTADEAERFALYKQMEEMLFSEEKGAFPVMPIYWYTYVNLERETIKDTFEINLLDQFDLTKVVVQEG
jgi:ABC-type oligopeptide transport system substrate-binding subunit